eukprot:scaffold34613_cov166-Amphora_coffeaeformis.AAC.11
MTSWSFCLGGSRRKILSLNVSPWRKAPSATQEVRGSNPVLTYCTYLPRKNAKGSIPINTAVRLR